MNAEENMKKLIVAILIIVVMATGCTGTAVPEELSFSEHLELGYKYIEEGKYEEAILAFQNAITIDEKSIEARVGLAEAYVGIEDLMKAEEVIKESINIEPTTVGSWELLIKIFEALERNPDSILNLYEQAYEATGEGRFKDWLNENDSMKHVIEVSAEKFEGVEINIKNDKEADIMLYGLDLKPTYTANILEEDDWEYGWTVTLFLKSETIDVGTTHFSFSEKKDLSVEDFQHDVWLKKKNGGARVIKSNLLVDVNDNTITWRINLEEFDNLDLSSLSGVGIEVRDVAIEQEERVYTLLDGEGFIEVDYERWKSAGAY
jgi:tetratricopeptide (TPR) repeat protein